MGCIKAPDNSKNIPMKKKIFKWHRTISLIIAIPAVLWATSGFMHPIMTTIRPKVATQFLQPAIIDSNKMQVSLRMALEENKIDQFQNFRLVHIDTNWFYQVQTAPINIPVYLSTVNGRPLKNGDELYAQYIAKQFLEGPFQSKKAEPDTSAEKTPMHDCCDAATNCVLLNDKGSSISAVKRITDFNDEYKYVNRLLPAYKVSFNRQDGIRVYVETTSDRFAFAVDNKRAVFDSLFSWFHTWSWMDAFGNAKYILMLVFLVLTMGTTGMGLYIFFITNTKKPKGNALASARRNHRFTSVFISLFTLLFSFSGAFHVLEKFKTDDRNDFYNRQIVKSSSADFDFTRLQKVVHMQIANISIVQMNDEWYWQVFTKEEKSAADGKMPLRRNDLMKDKTVPPPAASYISVSDGSKLVDGEKKYAEYLATLFSKHPSKEITNAVAILKFEDEYGFVNKRLPVWKIGYASNHHERYYVETSTGKLSVRVDDNDLYEGYSFAFFHKHHFMDFAGKEARDFSTMFWSFAQIALVVVGLILWRRTTLRKKN